MGSNHTVKDDSPSNRGLGTLVGGYVRRRLHLGVPPTVDDPKSDESSSSSDNLSDVRKRTKEEVGKEVCVEETHGGEPLTCEDERKDPLNDLTSEAINERERLHTAVIAYEETTYGTTFHADLSLSGTQTWEEVLTEVSGRLADLRQEISNALTEIPLLLTCIHRVLKIFETSQELRQWGLELYISTLGIIHHIINWYKQKSMVKVAKAILKQESYGSKLSSLIQDLRDKSTRFDKSAQLSSYEMGKETNLVLKAHDIQSRNDQETLLRRLDQIQLKSTDNQRDVDSIKAQISNLTAAICENFLAANSRVDFKTQQKYLRAQDKALKALDYDSSIVPHDIATSVQEVWRLPRVDQDRILAIIHSTKLKSWIIAAQSSALFINCNSNSSGSEKISSFTLAKLVESVVSYDSDHTISLSWFCGAHRGRGDQERGVVGLMRSLISQLLIAYPEFDVQTLGRISQVQPGDVDALCEIFYHLVHQLSSEIVVFCVIDSITTFELGTTYLDESELAVSQLVQIVQANTYSCVFKLLFSSPRNSRKLYKLMPSQSDVIWVPTRVPPSGGFTSAKWQTDVSERINRYNP
ncbi:hypothetical protein PENVUL_c005G05573 [Penicillium vulpinum]|uniref:DUF7708 domain-containing protein n=1 Tax=Penicillium vulpinum TaxID=29845 RepID=A0A1V6S8G7_9EURO|nr:hypothetical protein PENVUL_c005G05573 [Penicillium vulpinum]